ncbi:GntR family transcriptional regulator [Rothia sp. ZJ932]|uniref:GntR family transcriptional regulator n=1 Tax=Rothia sp. ZJ932 TaxID=2810516 RepID=UPI001967C21F|nr:GntR family transcriptional regulator [Rothia sp. ZJ932]QRZ61499.1 GntR family transcriptional regulator [Rothia sp. ZJ932]
MNFSSPTTNAPMLLSELVDASTPTNHTHAPVWAAQVLREAMIQGVLAPGAKLGEVQLTEQLGISRNTLRQAFTALEAEHLVTRVPNRGVFVVVPDAQQIQELFTLRLALEGAAIDLAPAREHTKLRAIITESAAHRERKSAAGMAAANQNFHRGLVALAGSPRLNALMAHALAEMRLLFHSMTTVPDFHAPFIDKNAHLLQLIENGQKPQARDYLHGYLEESAAYFAGRV